MKQNERVCLALIARFRGSKGVSLGIAKNVPSSLRVHPTIVFMKRDERTKGGAKLKAFKVLQKIKFSLLCLVQLFVLI